MVFLRIELTALLIERCKNRTYIDTNLFISYIYYAYISLEQG